MMRRTPGTGTVEDLPGGKARFKLTLADGTRHTSPRFASRQEAEEELGLMSALVARGALTSERGRTLGTYGENWLGLRRTANANTDRGLWKHHVLPTELAELPLAEVRPKALLGWAKGLRRHRRLVQVAGGGREESEEAISVQTQRLTWALVRRVLGAAVEEELIPVNPARGLRPEWPDVDLDDALSYLEEADILQLLACEAVPLAARHHYAWAIGAGPRQRESWALRWGQLDLQELQARITRSGARATTKAKKPRPFPLLPLAAEHLLLWREIAPDTRPDALVWPARLLPPAPGGTRWRSSGSMRANGKKGDDMGWADRSRGTQGVTPGHRQLAGLREGITYHDLRHTCAAGLLRGYTVLGLSRRWSLEEVCDFLGHSDRRTTERYAHIAGGGLAARAAAEGRAAAAQRAQEEAVEAQELAAPKSRPSPAASSVPPFPPSVTAARFERATYCLGNTPVACDPAGLDPKRDAGGTSARALAVEVIQLLASGDPHAVRRVIERCAEVAAAGVLAGPLHASRRAG